MSCMRKLKALSCLNVVEHILLFRNIPHSKNGKTSNETNWQKLCWWDYWKVSRHLGGTLNIQNTVWEYMHFHCQFIIHIKLDDYLLRIKFISLSILVVSSMLLTHALRTNFDAPGERFNHNFLAESSLSCLFICSIVISFSYRRNSPLSQHAETF